MRNSKIIFSLLMLWLVACGAPVTEQIPATLTSTVTQTDVTIVKSPTPFMSDPVLQLTFTNSLGDNFGEIYALDITCMTDDTLCYEEPRGLLKAPGRTPSTVSVDSPGSISDYSWSQDGNKVVLCAVGVDGRSDIFFTNRIEDSPKWINITRSPGYECNPKWNDSGNDIYFIAESNDPFGGSRLYSSNLAGDQRQIMLEGYDESISFYDISPDRKKVLFTQTDAVGNIQIWISDLDGSGRQQITSGDWIYLDPSFSPDGKTIVFVRWSKAETIDSVDQSDIIIKNLGTGVEKNTTEEIDQLYVNPAFSPDGSWIAFNSLDTSADEANIFAYAIANSVLIQITTNSYYVNPSWRLFTKQ